MQKRGIILLEVLVKLVPVILILLLFLAFVFVLLPAFFGTTNKEAKNSFQAIGQLTETMLSKNTVFETHELTITMPQGNLIKGYSSNALSEPVKCNGQACVCYFDKQENIIENRPVSCEVFEKSDYYDEIILLTMPDPLRSYPTEQAKLMYGLSWDPKPQTKYPEPLNTWSYGNLFIKPVGSSVNTKVLSNEFYIEKYAVDRKMYILMARIVEEKPKTFMKDGVTIETDPAIGITKEQKAQRENILRLCPQGSSQECAGKPANSKVGGQTCIRQADTTCTLTQIESCVMEEEAGERCLCGTKPIDAGNFCTQDKTGNYLSLTFSCSQVTTCADYCKYSTNELCNDQAERLLCGQDACKLGGCMLGSGGECAKLDSPQ